MEWQIQSIKLITGETLISQIKYDKLKKHAVLKNPLVFTYVSKESGAASIVATKWIETDKMVFTIKTYHIITTVDPSQVMHKLYLESIEEMEAFELEPEEESESSSKWDDLVDYMDALIDKNNVVH
jgi:hypothetical protein